MSSSYAIASDQHENDRLRNIFSKEKLEPIITKFKYELSKEVDSLWEENQTLKATNHSLEEMTKKNEPTKNDVNQEWNKSSQIVPYKYGRSSSVPEEFNFLDKFFPGKEVYSMWSGYYNPSERPSNRSITLEQFKQVQDSINKLLSVKQALTMQYHSLTADKEDWSTKEKSFLEQLRSNVENEKKLKAELDCSKNEISKLTEDLNKTEEKFSCIESLNKELQEKIKVYQNNLQKLNDKIQNQEKDHERSLVLLNSQLNLKKENLDKDKSSLEFRVNQLEKENNQYKILVNQGKENLNKYLKDEEERRQKEIDTFSTRYKEEIKTLKTEKSKLEQSREKLIKEKEKLKKDMNSTLQQKDEEKKDLINKEREKTENLQRSMLDLTKENNRLKIDLQQKINEMNLLSAKQATNDQTQSQNFVKIPSDKEQEYLKHLCLALQSGKIPSFAEKPKSLIEALEMIQKHFEEDS